MNRQQLHALGASLVSSRMSPTAVGSAAYVSTGVRLRISATAASILKVWLDDARPFNDGDDLAVSEDTDLARWAIFLFSV